MRAVLLLAAVTEFAAVLAADIRVGAVARPKPVVGAFPFVENGFGLVRDELSFTPGYNFIRPFSSRYRLITAVDSWFAGTSSVKIP